MTKKTIAIDLGTTFCCVAWYNGKKMNVEIIEDYSGPRVVPSVISFNDEGDLVCGYAAIAELKNGNIKNTFYDVKRCIGRMYNDDNVQTAIHSQLWPFTIESDAQGRICFKTTPSKTSADKAIRSYSAEELDAELLRSLKTQAEYILADTDSEEQLEGAVITVPAGFTMSQRQATRAAAEMAGLKVLQLCSEPAMAAIAYLFENEEENLNGNFMVFDFGGGTLDISVIKIDRASCDVLTTDGDMNLGGRDIDEAITNHFVPFCANHWKISEKALRDNAKLMRKIREASEEVKRYLSMQGNEEAAFNVESDGFAAYRITMLRIDFERQIMAPFKQRIISAIEKTLRPANGSINITKDSIDRIIMVGGSSNIPVVKKWIKEVFPARCRIVKPHKPDESIARGAAIMAALISGVDHESIKHLRLQERLPLTISVADCDDSMIPMVKRGSIVPFVGGNYTMQTGFDDQDYATIPLYEGEEPKAELNRLLCSVEIVGLTKRPAGRTTVSIKLHVDPIGGIMKAMVRELGSDREPWEAEMTDYSRKTQAEVNEYLADNERRRKAEREQLENNPAWRQLRALVLEKLYEANINEQRHIANICCKELQWLAICKETSPDALAERKASFLASMPE